MKVNSLVLRSAAFLITSSSLYSAVIVGTAEPTVDVLLDAINGGIQNGIINAGAAQGARGTVFSVGAAGEEVAISGITIQANQARTFASGEEFNIAFFSGTVGTFPAAGSFANVTPAYLDANSGLSLLASEIFLGTDATGGPSSGAVGATNFLTFEFANDIIVDGEEDITVMFFTNFAFSHREGNNNGGGRLQFREDTTTLAGSGSRDFRFSITGSVIPEPSSLALLALGGLAFARRRR